MTAQVIDMFSRRMVEPEPVRLASPPAFRPQLSEEELVARYLRQFGGTTMTDYRTDMGHYLSWIREDSGLGLGVYDVQTEDVKSWKVYQLDTLERPPSTVRRRMSSVGGMYSWGHAEGLCARNPFFGVKKPSVGSVSQYTGLTLEDVRTLSSYIRRCDPRTRAVVSVLMLTGLRVSELCNARVEGLSMRSGRLWLAVVRKGGRSDEVEIPRSAAAYLLEVIGLRSSGPLLLGQQGGALARSVVWRMVRSIGDRALPQHKGKLHPHDFRHTFVSGVLTLTGDIKEAQWRAAHADINNTVRYSHALQKLESRTAEDLASLFRLMV